MFLLLTEIYKVLGWIHYSYILRLLTRQARQRFFIVQVVIFAPLIQKLHHKEDTIMRNMSKIPNEPNNTPHMT